MERSDSENDIDAHGIGAGGSSSGGGGARQLVEPGSVMMHKQKGMVRMLVKLPRRARLGCIEPEPTISGQQDVEYALRNGNNTAGQRGGGSGGSARSAADLDGRLFRAAPQVRFLSNSAEAAPALNFPKSPNKRRVTLREKLNSRVNLSPSGP